MPNDFSDSPWSASQFTTKIFPEIQFKKKPLKNFFILSKGYKKIKPSLESRRNLPSVEKTSWPAKSSLSQFSNDASKIAVVVVATVVVVEVKVVVEVLEGIYSGLQCLRPETTAQYFIHNKLKYCILTKTVTKWLESLLAALQSQYWFSSPMPARIPDEVSK